MESLQIISLSGEKKGELKLNPEMFDGSSTQSAVYQEIRRLLASRRRGTADTLVRKEVRGGGRKPWRQKGTGRARVGSIRAPHWRGGGVVFGPHPRDFSFNLPKKVRIEALRSAVNDKWRNGALLAVDELKLREPKTKEVAGYLKKMKLDQKKVIFLFAEKNELFNRSARNIPGVGCKDIRTLNVFDVLYNDFLILTQSAFAHLEERLSAKK